MTADIKTHADTVWALADILRGTFKENEYGTVVLPFFVLRRLDCSLSHTSPAVLDALADLGDDFTDNPDFLSQALSAVSGYPFYNTSRYDFPALVADPANLEVNLDTYFDCFSPDVRDIIENFRLRQVVGKLAKAKILFQVIEKIASLDLSPEKVTNIEMGYIFEELLRRFSEMSNETAGEHYTPREVVRLCTRLAILEDPRLDARKGSIISIHDPACGTGGMLTTAEDAIRAHFGETSGIVVEMYGQEMNEETYATAKADLLIKGQPANRIALGNTLTDDRFAGRNFTYCLANPPYGVSWKQYAKPIEDEAKEKGYAGRFGAGTPPVSDGSLLFVQHIVSKLDPAGGRAAIVLNSSPLTNGDAGSGESNIRQWLLDNDLVDAVIALPKDMFYNTGIATYIWILDNNKPEARKGTIQLIDARGLSVKMRKALGSKRVEMLPEHLDQVAALYRDHVEGPQSKVLPLSEFRFSKVTVERPKRDEDGEIVLKKGKPVPDTGLRDTERIPWGEDHQAYLEREVHPYVPDAWIDETKTKTGVQIPIDQYFYVYEALPSVAEVEADLYSASKGLSARLSSLLSWSE